jgi:hypothetical protein
MAGDKQRAEKIAHQRLPCANEPLALRLRPPAPILGVRLTPSARFACPDVGAFPTGIGESSNRTSAIQHGDSNRQPGTIRNGCNILRMRQLHFSNRLKRSAFCGGKDSRPLGSARGKLDARARSRRGPSVTCNRLRDRLSKPSANGLNPFRIRRVQFCNRPSYGRPRTYRPALPGRKERLAEEEHRKKSRQPSKTAAGVPDASGTQGNGHRKRGSSLRSALLRRALQTADGLERRAF